MDIFTQTHSQICARWAKALSQSTAMASASDDDGNTYTESRVSADLLNALKLAHQELSVLRDICSVEAELQDLEVSSLDPWPQQEDGN